MNDLDMMAARGKWAAKLAKAQGQVKNVPKSERNKEQGYNFASAEKIFEMVRPVLSAVGLAVFPDVPTVEYNPEAGRSKSGTPYASARARIGFTMIDTDTGYGETAYFEGFGVDYGDKAIPKALTMCAKYWARVTFMIDLQDDAEKDNIRPTLPTPQGKQPPARPTPPAQPAKSDAPPEPPRSPRPDLDRVRALFAALHVSPETQAKTLGGMGCERIEELTTTQAAQLIDRMDKALKAKQPATDAA